MSDGQDKKPTIAESIAQGLGKNPLHSAFIKHHIDVDYLVGKLKGELNAKTTHVDDKGKSYDKQEWKIQQEARKDAHKLFNHYPPTKTDNKHSFGSFEDMTDAELDADIEKLGGDN